MAGSKPEELVAKLYDEGMTDDDVRAQLIEFGLSGREIHVLIKKAKEFIGEERKSGGGTDMRAPVIREAPLIIQEALPQSAAQKETTLQPSQEKKGGKPRFGIFGKKKEEKPEDAQAATGTTAQKPVGTDGEGTGAGEQSATNEQSMERLRALMGNSAREAPPNDKPGPLAQSSPTAMPAAQTPNASEKKSFLGGMFGKKQKEETSIALPPSDKKTEKAKKGKDKEAVKREDLQAKMKRLSLIKESISRPISTEARSATRPMAARSTEIIPIITTDEEADKAEQALSEVMKATSKTSEKTTTQKQVSKSRLSLEDEEKMDEEIARNLLEGIKSLESEMGEIKQLLETLRELNIKLIEIMESK